ncbi:MAG: hypothetical protein J4F98_13820 [Acidobacteria bacterium]|nr:hypothetical protein [Acidobacteriota bacterium]
MPFPIARRDFLKSALVGLGACFGTPAWAAQPTVDRDRFGGWTGLKFDATGFFRTEHDGRRWWLVTHAFISWGVNHYHSGWWAQDYNRDYWLQRFGAEQVDDPAWNRGFREAALADLRRLGLNTLGIHTNATMLTHPPGQARFPFVAPYEPLMLSHYLKPQPDAYADIFAPEFEAQCERTAQQVAAPYRDDPMVLGYCMADCPPLTDNEAEWNGSTTWPRRLRNFAAEAPGKQAYVDSMRERYGDVAGFNATYGTGFGGWSDLLNATDWRPDLAPLNQAERDDNAAFLLLCVDRYYSVARAALRRADPNHLFLGDKINGDMDSLNSIAGTTSQYTDLVNTQHYARWEGQRATMDRLTDMVGQPFLNGDAAYTTPTGTMPNPHGQHARDMAERALWTREFMENATARPDFVGWHMCGMIDTANTMPGKEQNQHQGLMTTRGEFYPEMEAAVRDISDRLYVIATSEA